MRDAFPQKTRLYAPWRDRVRSHALPLAHWITATHRVDHLTRNQSINDIIHYYPKVKMVDLLLSVRMACVTVQNLL
jgi:hypothetical protein